MDSALPAGRSLAPGVALSILALLPSVMVLHDGLMALPPEAALWAMPIPVAAALLALAGTGFLAARGQTPRLDRSGRLLALATLALFLWASLATLLRATDPAYGFLRLFEVALAAAVALALAGLVRTGGTALGRQMALALVLGIAAALLPMTLARAASWPEGFGKLDLAGFTHIRILGFSLTLGLAAATGLWAGETGRARARLFAAMVAMAAAMFWSGGRGALAALVLPLPVLALFLPTLRPGLLALLAALVAGALAASLLPGVSAEFGLFGRLTDLGESASADTLASGRLAIWRILMGASAEAPLLGHGMAQVHWILAAAGEKVAHLHAHNFVVEAALALGWPGTVAAILACAAAWIRWLLRARASGDPLHATGLALVSAFLAAALVDGPYFYWQGLLPLALGFALLAPCREGQAPAP